jgi:hypothetical protein
LIILIEQVILLVAPILLVQDLICNFTTKFRFLMGTLLPGSVLVFF